MVNLRELKLKGKIICDCGHVFTADNITELVQNNDYQFYGGRVAYYSKAKCPNCKKEVVLLLESYDCSYRVIDIGEEIKHTEFEEEIENEKQEEISNEIICPKCKRAFKTKSGLKIHEKSCINNG